MIDFWWLVAVYAYAGFLTANYTVSAVAKHDCTVHIGLRIIIWFFMFFCWPALPALERIFGE